MHLQAFQFWLICMDPIAMILCRCYSSIMMLIAHSNIRRLCRDMSSNSLSGELPPSMSNLSLLTTL